MPKVIRLNGVPPNAGTMKFIIAVSLFGQKEKGIKKHKCLERLKA
jgi:hypothetical protein